MGYREVGQGMCSISIPCPSLTAFPKFTAVLPCVQIAGRCFPMYDFLWTLLWLKALSKARTVLFVNWRKRFGEIRSQGQNARPSLSSLDCLAYRSAGLTQSCSWVKLVSSAILGVFRVNPIKLRTLHAETSPGSQWTSEPIPWPAHQVQVQSFIFDVWSLLNKKQNKNG